MGIKIEKIIIVFLMILMCNTQIIFPLALYTNKKIEKSYKTVFIPKEEIKKESNNWQIEIPKINLKAKIQDGTDNENLNKYVGHFTESSYINGNVCLAAHNRGYKVNYFQNIKKLQKGDKIIYEFKNVKQTYIVTENKVIKDTDVQEIENTKENIITLITCVENEPEKRRCIKGKLET